MFEAVLTQQKIWKDKFKIVEISSSLTVKGGEEGYNERKKNIQGKTHVKTKKSGIILVAMAFSENVYDRGNLSTQLK
jgi:hypothetical protein